MDVLRRRDLDLDVVAVVEQLEGEGGLGALRLDGRAKRCTSPSSPTHTSTGIVAEPAEEVVDLRLERITILIGRRVEGIGGVDGRGVVRRRLAADILGTDRGHVVGDAAEDLEHGRGVLGAAVEELAGRGLQPVGRHGVPA